MSVITETAAGHPLVSGDERIADAGRLSADVSSPLSALRLWPCIARGGFGRRCLVDSAANGGTCTGADGLRCARLFDRIIEHLGIGGNLFFGGLCFFRFLAKDISLFRYPAGMATGPAGDIRRKREGRRC